MKVHLDRKPVEGSESGAMVLLKIQLDYILAQGTQILKYLIRLPTQELLHRGGPMGFPLPLVSIPGAIKESKEKTSVKVQQHI